MGDLPEGRLPRGLPVLAALLLWPAFASASLAFDSPNQATELDWSADQPGLDLGLPPSATDAAIHDVSLGEDAVAEPDPRDLITSTLGAPDASAEEPEEENTASSGRTMAVIYVGSAVVAGFLFLASVLSGTAIFRMRRQEHG